MTATYNDYAHKNAYGSCATPSTGTAKLLVIPIWFTDSTSYIATSSRENIRSDIQTAYFGTNEETGWRSVKTFYEEESIGSITLTGTVSEWYEVGKAASYYASDDTGSNRTSSLASSASDWYFNNHTSEKRRDYDCDKDGYLDGVMLIYAYPDYSALGNSSYGNLWAYCFWASSSGASTSNPKANQFFWASYDFMYSSGSKASSRTGKSSLGSGETDYCNIDAHTYIHEMGHMFGLEDYYDYSSYRYSPAGSFSMQDHNVGSHDAFSILALGWGKAYIPTETTTIHLKPMTKTGEMILLTPSWNSYNSAFDEYLLLEYFTPDGVNELDCAHQYGSYAKGPQVSGIRLWHVDARLLYVNYSNYVYDSSYGGYVLKFTTNQFTSNPNYTCDYGVMNAFSNTYDDGSVSEGYLSPLGGTYCDYNLLQLIHNSTTMSSSKSKSSLSSSSLFREGSSFSMSKYGKQFCNVGKLNSNIDLGFTFEVNSLNSEYASITVTKI